MAQIKNVDITPGGVQTTVINVSQDDVGRVIVFNVKDGSGPFDLTDYTVKLAGLKPSGLGFSVNGDIDTSKVTITTTKQMTDEYGQIACELQILDGDDIKIGTANMILAVERNPHPDHTTDGSVDDLIPEITVLVERAEAAAGAALENGPKAEGYAVGKQGGVDVGSDSPYYHNNAKYYSEQAGGSASTASTNGLKAEGYAVGKQNGTDVESGSTYYHNNAKYYKEKTEEAAESVEGLVGNLAKETTQLQIEGETDSIVDLLTQIVEQGHSSGDLNGYSLNPGAGDEILITYTNPEDETDTVTITAPTNTTMSAIATALADLANTWKGAIITNG